VPVTAMESLLDEIARLLVEKEGTSLKTKENGWHTFSEGLL
jgi:hypothetical protein